jgi:hypothetical protein
VAADAVVRCLAGPLVVVSSAAAIEATAMESAPMTGAAAVEPAMRARVMTMMRGRVPRRRSAVSIEREARV